MGVINDPTHPYYFQADPVVEDVNKVHPDLALLGDSLEPVPTLKKMGPSQLEDIARRSENLSTEDRIQIQQMEDMLHRSHPQHQPQNSRKSFVINAPWKSYDK